MHFKPLNKQSLIRNFNSFENSYPSHVSQKLFLSHLRRKKGTRKDIVNNIDLCKLNRENLSHTLSEKRVLSRT